MFTALLVTLAKTASEIAISQIILGMNTGITVYAATRKAQNTSSSKKR